MKLSDVKTEKDWEEYEYRKSMESHERLRVESGIGPGGYRLAAPYDFDADGMDLCDIMATRYGEEIFEDIG